MTSPTNPRLFLTAVALFAVSVALLPAWDALAHPAGLLIAAIAGGAALVEFRRAPGVRRWVVLCAGILFIVLYASFSGGALLLQRSREVDRLLPCAEGRAQPCLARGESRDDHRATSPNGDLEDGFRQVIVRYPGDEAKLILGPMMALFLAASAGLLMAKALPRRVD